MKIAVLVSGGVDSSVALALVKEQWGKDNIEAFYLKIWLEDELSYLGQCPWQEDLLYVESVCKQLDIKLNILPLQKEYFQKVVSYTTLEVKAGRTPNPDILCNQEIKFGAFISKVGYKFDFIATGHYAQIERTNDDLVLKCSKDKVKDQTYFLAYLSQEQLSKALFPIGHLTKAEVRELAKAYNLPNQSRKDSQGICFLGKLKFNDFIKAYLGQKQGDLVEFETNKKLGQHNGFWFYTIGQRKSIGLSQGPFYVVSKDIEKNIVYVSSNYNSEDKKRDTVIISSINWLYPLAKLHLLIEDDISNKMFDVKLRHGQKFYQSKLIKLNDDQYKVILNENDHAIAAGQFVVVYYNEQCILSGIIN